MGIVQAVHRKTGKTGVEVKALAGEILLVLLRELKKSNYSDIMEVNNIWE